MNGKLTVLALTLVLLTTGCVVSTGYARPVESRPVYTPPPQPAPSVDVGFFYDSLAPYGDWFFDAEFGWVWTPYNVAVGWRPYTDGRWLYSDYGWTWVSSYDWGWAPFHYGRWSYHPHRGWIWIPGREWAPAWVAWRSGGGWVGWAPLPPGARFRAGFGLDIGDARLDSMIAVHWWSFVEERRIVDVRIRSYVVPEPRNVTLVKFTRDVTRYEVNHDRVFVRGVDVDDVRRVTGHAVPRYQVREEASGKRVGQTRVRANDVFFYRPTVREASSDRTPPGHDRREKDVATTQPPANRPAPNPVKPGPTARPASPRVVPNPSARPAPAPTPARPAPAVDQKDRQRLDQQLRREQTAMERRQREESAKPPQGTTRQELQRRHQQEQKAFEQQAQRQRALREARAAEARQRRQQQAAERQRKRAEPQRKQEEQKSRTPRSKNGDASRNRGTRDGGHSPSASAS